MQKGRRGSWIEIDTGAIKANYAYALSMLSEGAEAYAVIKSNAYGHGDVEVGLALYAIGARRFAVASLEEAVHLRESALPKDADILILGYTPPQLMRTVAEYGIVQTVVSPEHAAEIAECGTPLRTHIAVDTGMHRIGFDASAPYIERVLKLYEPLRPEGIFTHLAVADGWSDSDREFTASQISLFERVASVAKRLGIRDIHALNSAGVLYYANCISPILKNLARPGIMLYGISPRADEIYPDRITPALSWKASIAMIKTLRKGESIGYGRGFVAPEDMTVATIPVGYGDGYPRLLSGKGAVLIRGKRAPIVGRICMNQMMVDASDIDGISLSDEVTLIGSDGTETVSAAELASLVGTIGYEIVTGISESLPRFYKTTKIPEREEI